MASILVSENLSIVRGVEISSSRFEAEAPAGIWLASVSLIKGSASASLFEQSNWDLLEYRRSKLDARMVQKVEFLQAAEKFVASLFEKRKESWPPLYRS